MFTPVFSEVGNGVDQFLRRICFLEKDLKGLFLEACSSIFDIEICVFEQLLAVGISNLVFFYFILLFYFPNLVPIELVNFFGPCLYIFLAHELWQKAFSRVKFFLHIEISSNKYYYRLAPKFILSLAIYLFIRNRIKSIYLIFQACSYLH